MLAFPSLSKKPCYQYEILFLCSACLHWCGNIHFPMNKNNNIFFLCPSEMEDNYSKLGSELIFFFWLIKTVLVTRIRFSRGIQSIASAIPSVNKDISLPILHFLFFPFTQQFISTALWCAKWIISVTFRYLQTSGFLFLIHSLEFVDNCRQITDSVVWLLLLGSR